MLVLQTITNAMPLIIQLINYAENLFQGKKRGADRKKFVVSIITKAITLPEGNDITETLDTVIELSVKEMNKSKEPK